ncbi:MAG: NosD domain-containing protein [Methanolobus sp.]
MVYPDTYTETINVNKSGISIISTGGSSETDLIAPSSGNVFYVGNVEGVTINGFNVSGPAPVKGVYLYHSDNCTVANITANSISYGVYLENSGNNTLANNNLENNSHQGIRLVNSNYNSILENTAISNLLGIYILDSNYNTLTGNTANGSTQFGIQLKNSTINTVTDNRAFSNGYDGITLTSSFNNTVTGNTAGLNTHYGIYLNSSNNGTVTGNTINSNAEIGIWVEGSDNCTVTNNTANLNPRYGIALEYADNNLVANNTAVSNGAGASDHTGFALGHSNDNTITNNIAESNTNGIAFAYSSGNLITNNTAGNSTIAGVFAYISGSNTVAYNTINQNTYGIMMAGASGNLIYNNIFNNAINFVDAGSTGANIWNVSREQGPNVIGGVYLGGNYWSTPTETGFSQVIPDSNGDGICDSEKTLASNNVDYLALRTASPILTLGNIENLAVDWGAFNLNHSVTVQNQTADNVIITYDVPWIPDYNLNTVPIGETRWLNQTISNNTVQRINVLVFTNTSTIPAFNDSGSFSINITPRDIIIDTNPVSQTVDRIDDFRINASAEGEYNETFLGNASLLRNGIVVGNPVSVTDGNASFSWNETASGDYTFAVLFYNTSHYYNRSSAEAEITVQSSSGSSSGSGGGGGSPASDDVITMDIETLFVKKGFNEYMFDDPQGPVANLSFFSNHALGNVNANVQVLANGSTTPEYPDSLTKMTIRISVGNQGTLKDADDIHIKYKVDKNWISENNVDSSTIRLALFSNDEWIDMPTTAEEENSEFRYFSTDTSDLGTFRIVGDEFAVGISEEVSPDEDDNNDEAENPVLIPAQEGKNSNFPVAAIIPIVILLAGIGFVLIKQRKDEEE